MSEFFPLRQSGNKNYCALCGFSASFAVSFYMKIRQFYIELTFHYGALINAYGKARQPDKAREVFDDMTAKGLKPNETIYGALVNAYGQAGQPEDAEKILRNLPEGLNLSSQTLGYLYNLVIKGYGRANRVEDVNRLKEEMLQKGLPIDVYTLGATGSVYDRMGTLNDETRSLRSREAEQWKELATLFGDVVHELNQPVGAIGLGVSTVKRYFEKGDRGNTLKFLEKLRLQVQFLGERMQVYKALTERSNAEETHRVSDMVSGVEELLRHYAEKAHVRIDIQITDDNKWKQALYLRGDKFLFQMAIRGLVYNAIQACSEESIPLERRHIIIRGIFTPSRPDEQSVAPYGWVDIYVRDEGPGIPPGIRERIFERGFSTKKGRGLGLGLTLAQSVAEHYGGRIVLMPEIATGVEFWLRLPAAPEP